MRRWFILSVILLGALASGRSENAGPSVIEVSGSATVNIIPERITIEIGMEEYCRPIASGDSVIVSLSDIERGVRQVLREAGIPDSLTVVSDMGNYRSRDVSSTFMMAKRLSATLYDFDQIERVSDRLGRSGISSFNIINTDNSDMEHYNREGLKAALDAARQKAEFIADNEGLELLVPYEIQETTNEASRYGSISNVTYDAGVGMENIRRISRRYSVKVRYLFKPKGAK